MQTVKTQVEMAGHKDSRVPSPRNPAVYKTNLTNRHEKNSDVLYKGNDLKSISKLLQKNRNKNYKILQYLGIITPLSQKNV